MIRKINTKTLLGQSIMELMKKMPLEKISVYDITENCMMRRETFYYHFIDKYDLIRWIYENEVYDKLVSDFKGAGNWEYVVKRCIDWLDYFTENRNFAQNALKHKYNHPNGFHQSLVNCTFKQISAHAKYSFRTDQLSKETLFYINFYTSGIVNMCEDWIRRDMQESTRFMGEVMANSMPGDLKKVYFLD